jgi:hypothetical protein
MNFLSTVPIFFLAVYDRLKKERKRKGGEREKTGTF